MRLHPHRPVAPPRATVHEHEGEWSLAEQCLGRSHPLVTSLGRSEIVRRQLLTVTAVQAAGLIWFLGGWSFGLSLAIGAGVAQAALACRLALLRTSRRGLCLEMIAHGGEWLPLVCVERVCRSLMDTRALERLAGSIDELVLAAGCPGVPALLSQPLADRRVIRSVAPELRQVAALLRSGPAVQGVALVEWLLTSPATPLYGREVEPLRQELRRARYLLTPD
jgi:hypothetical protein